MDTSNKPFLFHGVVSASDPGTFVVQIDPKGSDANVPVMQAIPLASVFATALGFRETFLPPVGSNVLCVHINSNLCYIVGVVPDHDKGELPYPSRAALKAGGDNVYDEQNTVGYDTDVSKAFSHNNCRPTDVTEGDVVWANDFGVLLGAFQQVAMLKGSELSQVQAFLLDDLVRIVSHNYEHFHSMGEFRIHHDGKALLMEMGATHLSQEAMGLPRPEDDAEEPVFSDVGQSTPDDTQDFYEHTEKEKRVKAIERFKLFMGRLADFLQLYVVRPREETRRDFDGGQDSADRGMFRMHVGTDGGLHLQTVTRCHIEKTNWIRVPERVRSCDDPEGDDAEEIEYDEKILFEFKNDYKYRENPFLYFLQLRNFAAYLNKVTYQNFDKHEKDFKVDKQSDDQTSFDQIEKVDSKTPVNFKEFKLRTSGIYLMDNGGILLKDAWGSAIVMEGGNIYFQAARDEFHQPMRNMIAKVGQNISLAAKKDIDFSSTEEGVRIKAEKCAYIYSNTQGVAIESKAENDGDPDPTDEAVERLGGVVLKSTKGIYTYSETLMNRATERHIMKTKQLWMKPEEQMFIISEGQVILTGNGISIISDSNMLCVGSGSAVFAGSQTALGEEGVNLGVTYDDNSPFVDVIKGAVTTSDIVSGFDSIKDIDPQSISPSFREDAKFDDLKFRFLNSDKYNLDDKEDVVPQTIVQQECELGGEPSLKAWKEKEVESTLPFPGKDKFDNFYAKSELYNLTQKNGEVVAKGVNEVSETVSSINTSSLNDYKVLE